MNFIYLENGKESWVINPSSISAAMQTPECVRVYFTGGKDDFIDLSMSLEVFSEHLKDAGVQINY